MLTLFVLLITVAILFVTYISPFDLKRIIIVMIYISALCYFSGKTLYECFRINYKFIQTQCMVTSKDILTKHQGRSTIYEPILMGQYIVDGVNYSGNFQINADDNGVLSYASAKTIIDPFTVSQSYYCWYDPSNPSTVVMMKGWYSGFGSWKMIIVSGMILCVLIAKLFI